MTSNETLVLAITAVGICVGLFLLRMATAAARTMVLLVALVASALLVVAVLVWLDLLTLPIGR